MITLTSNINDEILRELIDRSPECHRPCSTCEKPDGMSCTECAKNGNCFKMLSNFNDYVMFSTGTNVLGYQFAVNKKVLSNFLAGTDCPWETKDVEDFIKLCTENNEALVNNEAIRLFKLLKNNSVFQAYKEPAQMLGDDYFWCRYADASGGLRNAQGKSLVSYDICKSDEIEYRLVNADKWKWFYGTFEEFKCYIEELLCTPTLCK